ncbi:MAG TPA: hypothetical protein DF383_00985 [Deltaproteobacteria bacterium]|nr:hypothetical protein [Deltaproteobacteria bacterium]
MRPTLIFLGILFGLFFITLTLPSAYSKDDKPTTETFMEPREGKSRLAYCFTPGEGCGEKAANAWCKVKGFKGAKEWKVHHQTEGKVRVTRYIGTEGTCRTRDCDTFESITCRMGPPTFF